MSKKYNNIKKNVMALLMVLALILSGMFSRLLGNKLVEADTDNPCGIFPIPTRNLVYQNNYAQTGDDVRWVQMFLIVVMGYYDLSLDGSYGPNTRNAVKRFQNDTYSRFGLTADGKVGDYTRNAMLTMWKEYYYYNYTPVTQKRYNGHLYEVYDCNVKWADAAYLAESKGGHLITITSAAENQMIKDLIQNCASDFYWLGGTDYGTEGTFKWVNGESFSYTNFESGQPDNCIYGNYFAEDYLMIYKSTGTWNDYLDYKACAYIVEYDQVTANYSYDYNETLLGSATADNHWLELYECGVKWTEAKEFAQQKGGHLFTYTSNYSGVVALNNLLKNYGKSKKYWVGLTDRETEGVFMKVSGEQYRSGYMTWGEGEPNNTIHYDTCGTDEDYVAINSTTLEMNDINDEQAYGYIVEYDYMPVDSVSISSASIEMACGETCNLKVVISPENAANNEKTWWSSDNTIASVNKNGVVTAVGEGQTYIKVKVKTIRGYIQKSCPVKVTKTPSQMCEENGHIWDEGTVTHSETCTTDGTRKYVCTVCGEIKNETIKASGHKYQSRCEWHDDEGYATFYITCKNDPSHQGIVDTTNIVANVISETDTEKKIMYTATAGFEGWTFSNTKTVVISKVNPPVISIQPSNASMIWGGTAEFTVNATGDTLEYQWYESIDNGESWNVCNETGNTTNSIMITVGKSHDGRMYKCKISNEGGTVYSNPVKLTANSIISTQPKAVTVKEGDKATFSVACGSDSVKYQWQVSDNNGQSWDNSGATGNKTNAITFITKLKQNGYLYRCKVTNGNEVEYSKSVKLTVKSTVVITPPTITTAPSDASVVRGNTAKFTVSASGDNLKYQWYVSSDGGKTWSASGATGNKTKSITLNATKTLNGRYFKCEISNDGGKISTSPVKLTTLSVISTQPKAQTVTEGGKATFSIASRATNASYQWEVSSDSGKTWKNSGASGNTSKAISFTSKLSQNGYCFRCKATNGSWSEYSSTVKLTVNKKAVSAPVVTTQPSDVSIIRGSTGKITVKATGTGLKYQWYVSSDSGKSWSASGLTGNKTNTITIKATESLNGKVFRCKITNEGGSVYSNKALCTTLSVIRVQPTGKMINAQSVATFSVKSRSSVVKYQWQISSDNGKTWNNSYVTGATSDTISFKAEPGQDGYCYRCKLTNGTWEEYTVKVKLRVTAAITVQPALILDNVEQPPASVITVEKDKQVRVKIKVYGNSTLYDYQWQVSSDSGKTWNDIKGATLSIYIFTPLSKQNGYKYRCVVSNKNNNSDGKAKTISDAFTLKVK